MNTKFLQFGLVCFGLLPALLSHSGPRVIKDIYPGAVPQGSSPREFARLNDRVLFSALLEGSIGRELWITDGTESGTKLVRDLRIGSSWGEPEGIIELNGVALFAGDDGIHGNELWITDGTPGGTRMLKDLDPIDGDPESLVRYKDRIFFSAENEPNGQEVFVSDGTEEGTLVFVDLVPGPDDSDPEQLAVAADLLFFVADLPDTGEELWVTDGTVDGTRLVKDINPGDSDADIEHLTAVSDGLFFVADDGVTGEELWFTDGSEEGTRLVRDIRPGGSSASPRELVLVGGMLYFAANTSEFGTELWKTDGTLDGTLMIKDIRAGTGASNPSSLTALGDRLVFSAFTDAESSEPWVSDGTPEGTFLLKDIVAGSDGSIPGSFARVGDTVFFDVNLAADSYQLWKTDGTPEGTVPVKDVNVRDPGIVLNGKLLFAGAGNDAIASYELWISDGTPAGTLMVKNIAPDVGSASPGHLTAVGDSVYFGALEGIEGNKRTRVYSIWKSDGFHSTTERMTYLTSERFPGDLIEIASLDETTALFSGRIDTTLGFELGISDGTPEGTRILKDFNPGPRNSDIKDFIAFNNHLYFSNNFQLWRTDGTEAGTIEIWPNFVSAYAVALGDLYFQSRASGEAGGQLWRAGTGPDTASEVAVINPGAFAQINFITEYKGALFFTATDQGINNVERELWTSGGVSTASEVKDIRPGPAGSNPTQLTVAGDLLFFHADDGLSGYELWKSDGTAAGTVLVKDIMPGPESSGLRASKLIAYKDEVYFAADDGLSGVELWKSDGTAEGTRLVKDLYPGPLASMVPFQWNPVEFEGLLYFAAVDPEHGYELWKTDGTPEGTQLAFDILPGNGSSVPEQLTVADGRLYFTAFSPRFGNELHVYDPDFINVPIALRLDGNQVLLEWPHDPDRNLLLESSSGFGDWAPVSAPTNVSGDTASVTLPIEQALLHFRLVEP